MGGQSCLAKKKTSFIGENASLCDPPHPLGVRSDPEAPAFHQLVARHYAWLFDPTLLDEGPLGFQAQQRTPCRLSPQASDKVWPQIWHGFHTFRHACTVYNINSKLAFDDCVELARRYELNPLCPKNDQHQYQCDNVIKPSSHEN